MTQAARWKLEEGSTLGSLEQLLGSRTVGGALLAPLHLRSFNMLAMGLILLWTFSPLGAQAMLRIVEPRMITKTTSSDVTYFDTLARSMLQDWRPIGGGSGEPIRAVSIDVLNTIYSGVLLTPAATKNDTIDLWQNVKIPLISRSKSKMEHGGWRNVPNGETSFSSLVGVPAVNVKTGNTTFEMESNYVEVVCEHVKTYDWENKTKMIEINETAMAGWTGYHLDLDGAVNGTFQGWPDQDRNTTDINGKNIPVSAPWAIGVDRLADVSWANGTWGRDDPDNLHSLAMFAHEEGIEAGPTRLLFRATVGPIAMVRDTHMEAVCNITQRYVESRVACERRSASERETCRVSAQRPSRVPHGPENLSWLNFAGILSILTKHLPMATSEKAGILSNLDLTLQYLADPAMGNMDVTQGQPVNLWELDPEVFSMRLTQALNSYLHLGQMWINAMGNSDRDGVALRQNITTSAQVNNIVTVYRVPKVWAILCIFSCFILLCGAVLGVVFAHVSVGAEVLGFASTAIRDNKYISLPSQASTMDGADVTGIFKNMRVRFGVLQGDKEESVGVGFQDSVSRLRDVIKMARG